MVRWSGGWVVVRLLGCWVGWHPAVGGMWLSGQDGEGRGGVGPRWDPGGAQVGPPRRQSTFFTGDPSPNCRSRVEDLDHTKHSQTHSSSYSQQHVKWQSGNKTTVTVLQ